MKNVVNVFTLFISLKAVAENAAALVAPEASYKGLQRRLCCRLLVPLTWILGAALLKNSQTRVHRVLSEVVQSGDHLVEVVQREKKERLGG